MKASDIKVGESYIFNYWHGRKDIYSGKTVKVVNKTNTKCLPWDWACEVEIGGETIWLLASSDELSEISSSTKTSSITLNIQDVIDQLKPKVVEMVEQKTNSLWEDKGNKSAILQSIGHYTNFENWNTENLGLLWCEKCSEKFFSDNPDVVDVLMAKHTDPDGTQYKMWLASR